MTVGAVWLLEQDRSARHSDVLLRYFLAEGLAARHGLCVAGESEAVEQQLWRALPSQITQKDQQKDAEEPVSDERMTIAWRYQNMMATAPTAPAFSHDYDLSRPRTEPIDTETASVHDRAWDGTPFYPGLLDRVTSLVEQHYGADQVDKSTAADPATVLRVVVRGLGHPAFGTDTHEILRCVHALKLLARESLVICLVSVDAHTMRKTNPALLAHLEHLADGVFTMSSFADADEPVSEAFADYSGLFTLIKLPRLNSLMMLAIPEAMQLAYKLRRRRFMIEQIFLPPEPETSQKRMPSSGGGGGSGPACAPGSTGLGAKNPLDY